MTPNNNLSVLPWYESLSQQNARKWWVFGRVYPLFTPAGYILPFQLIVPHAETPAITSVALFNGNTNESLGEYVTSFVGGGLTVKQFIDYDVVIFPGSGAIFGSMANGRYYLTMTVNGTTYYSEVFTVVNDIEPYLEIEWWNVEDFVMDAGTVVYTEPAFKNKIFLQADIAKPEYLFEEEGETRDGYFFPTKQISEKRYRFSFFASEYLLDVMRFIRMADYVKIYKNGQTYTADTFLITPEWEAEGDVAAVSAEFDTSTVAKKLPYRIEGVIPPTPEDHYLTVSPTSITFLPAGQTVSLNIVSDITWVLSLPAWLSADVLTGTGNATVQLTAQANSEQSPNTGDVVVSGGGMTRNVTVMQPAADAAYLSVSPASINFNAAGQTVSVSVNASAGLAWTLTVPSWVTASQLSGTGSANITLTAPANTTGSGRPEAYAVFSASGVSNANILLNQAAQITPSLSVWPNDRVYDSQAHTFYYQVTCNGRWRCSSSSAPGWLTCDSTGDGNGTATIVMRANSGSQRNGTLTFQMVDYPSVTYEVRITQEAYAPTITYALELSLSSKTLSAGGENYTLSVEGVTYTNGVETSRRNLSASALTITQSGSNAISRNGLTFSAQNLGTTPTNEQTANFSLVWDEHSSATATFTCKQQANTSVISGQNITYTPAQGAIYWGVGGSGNASATGDNARLDPDITKTTVQYITWTSGSQETNTITETVQGSWTTTGDGLSTDSTQQLLWWTTNNNPQQRTGTLTLKVGTTTVSTWNLTQDAAQVTPQQITISYRSSGSTLTVTSTARYLHDTYVGWWTPIGQRYTTLYPVVGDTVYNDSALTQTFGVVSAVVY